jgi:phosphatidylglycerol---prolipoprotein diacylglyceryl transferase
MTAGSVFTVLGYLTGAIVLLLAARAARWDSRHTLWLLIAGLIGGTLGGKLTQWLVLGWPFTGAAQLAQPELGGRTILGGIVCGWLAVELAKRQLGVRRSTGDLFALALPAGEAVGRIGCLLNGCCYGAPCTWPWAVYQHGAWRHPTQIYSALAALLILALLLALRKRLWREGDLFWLYLLAYGLSRFGIEFLRFRDHLYAGLSLAQWFSLELALMGAIALGVSAIRGTGGPRAASL